MKRTILILVLAGGLLGGWYAWSEYNRKPEEAGDAEVAHTISAAELIAAFETDEQDALKQYSEGVLLVKGELIELEEQGEKVNLHLAGEGPMSRVTCEFEASAAPAVSVVDEPVKKGFCAGFTGFDVILQRCALAE